MCFFALVIITLSFLNMIKHNSGEETINAYKKSASVTFAKNDVVTRDSSGYLVKATATTPKAFLLGLIQEDVLATDADYAQNTYKSVLEFNTGSEEAEFLADVDTGTAVQSMVGKYFDLNDENGINVNSTLQKCFKITKIISTTKVLGKFVISGSGFELISYQQTVLFSEFTDGGGASGTKDLGVVIPAGAVYARTLITDITGFTGNTSATFTLGDGSDVDRYNTGTPSVFTTASQGVDAGAPSGTAWHTANATPKITVTGASDFTNITAGQLTVTLFFYVAK